MGGGKIDWKNPIDWNDPFKGGTWAKTFGIDQPDDPKAPTKMETSSAVGMEGLSASGATLDDKDTTRDTVKKMSKGAASLRIPLQISKAASVATGGVNV